jgi:hypothetical protein
MLLFHACACSIMLYSKVNLTYGAFIQYKRSIKHKNFTLQNFEERKKTVACTCIIFNFLFLF